MADNKSVLEQALLEAQQLEEAVKSNAKEILASTMKQEIEELVKESLNEEEEDDFVDMEDEEKVSMDFDDDDEEYEDQEEEEFMMAPGEEEAMVSMEMGTDEPALDLTQASDDEVLKVFKSMGAEDGIVVTQDGDTIDIEDQEAGTEYKIELAESKLRNNLLIREGYDKKDSMDETFVDDVEEMNEMDKETKEGHYGKKHMGEMDHMEDETNEGYGKKYMDEMDHMDKESNEGYGKKHMGEMDHMDKEAKEGYGEKYMNEMGMMKDEPVYEISLDDEMGLDEMEDMDVEELNEMGYDSRLDSSLGMTDGKESSKTQSYTSRRRESEGMEKYFHRPKFSSNKHSEQHMGEMKSDEEIGEASRTYGFGSKSGRGLRKAISNNRNYEYPMNESSRSSIQKIIATAKQLQTENRQFREKNKEYRQALKVFRNKLNEVAVFNANLAYSTKLFTEHTTTKKEKVNILRRFDGVTTLNESKNLFKSLSSELNSKVNKLNESVQKTITKTPSGGSSVNLIESKTYESPQITRMREIMGKL